MATAATAKQNSKERRGEGKIKPCSGLFGVFKVMLHPRWEAEPALGADAAQDEKGPRS